jgi:phosphate-selective porin OprO/OprP
MAGRSAQIRPGILLAMMLTSLALAPCVHAQQPGIDAAVVEQLMKRIDVLEKRDSENAALRDQVRVLQDRLRKLEGQSSDLGASTSGAGERVESEDAKDQKHRAGSPVIEHATLRNLFEPDASQTDGAILPALEVKPSGAGPKPPTLDETGDKLSAWTEVGKNLGMKATWNNGLQFASEDDAFRFHLGGRVDFDNAWFRADKNLLVGQENGDRLRDGSDFRRMRLRADGRFWENVDFVFEVNFANFQDFSNTGQQVTIGSVGLTDVNLTFREVPIFSNIKVGHLLPPISLEHMTSSNFVYYMERSPQFDAFINRFDYVNGINAFDTYLDDRATLSYAFIRTGSRTVNPFGAGAGFGEYGAVIRGTWLPIDQEEGRELLHLGLSVMHRALDEETSSPSDRSLVRSGAGREIPNVMATARYYAPEGQFYVNPELAVVFGRWAFSSEYLLTGVPEAFATRLNRNVVTDRRGPLFYHGTYAELGYFLTPGDYRRYNRQVGSFDRTVPFENAWIIKTGKGRPSIGRGAVQMLARYSFLDLMSGNPVLSPSSGARAGIEHDITLGLAWYLNPQSNIQLNYIRTYINSYVAGASGDFDALGLRFHFDF